MMVMMMWWWWWIWILGTGNSKKLLLPAKIFVGHPNDDDGGLF